MLIDWFTVGAQALNFLILVWLMKHFLYKPILDAIAAREKLVATELANAAKALADARKAEDEFKQRNTVFDGERDGLLKKAADEAQAERQRLLDEARKAAAALSSKLQDAARNDEHRLHQAIRQRTQEEVFAIARKALTDLATASLEERLGEVFTRRLRTIDEKAKASLGAALKRAADPALVRSAFELPPEQCAVIQNAVNETFSADIPLHFETAPDLVGGIELTANGQKVSWSIGNYLDSLEAGVDALLKQQEARETEAKATPPTTPGLKAEAKAEPVPETKSAGKPDAKAPVTPKAKAEPEPEVEAEPQPKPKGEPIPPVKGEAKPKAGTEPPPDAKAEPKPETKAAPTTDTKAASSAETPKSQTTRK
jgi:F-type H+-transporting ATPase subunit b